MIIQRSKKNQVNQKKTKQFLKRKNKSLLTDLNETKKRLNQHDNEYKALSELKINLETELQNQITKTEILKEELEGIQVISTHKDDIKHLHLQMEEHRNNIEKKNSEIKELKKNFQNEKVYLERENVEKEEEIRSLKLDVENSKIHFKKLETDYKEQIKVLKQQLDEKITRENIIEKNENDVKT